MLTALSLVKSAGGGTINFNVGATTQATTYTVSRLDFDPQLEGEEIKQLESSGQFENFVYIDSQLITVQGQILGTTAAAYMTNRAALMAVVLPDSGVQTVRAHGTVYATFTGINQVYAPVVLTDIQAPLAVGEGPFDSDYQLIWRNHYGYWRYVSGDADAKL